MSGIGRDIFDFFFTKNIMKREKKKKKKYFNDVLIFKCLKIVFVLFFYYKYISKCALFFIIKLLSYACNFWQVLLEYLQYFFWNIRTFVAITYASFAFESYNRAAVFYSVKNNVASVFLQNWPDHFVENLVALFLDFIDRTGEEPGETRGTKARLKKREH